MGKMTGKIAIVTGGGTGIGAASAQLFAQEGAQVLIVGRREEKLIETVKAAHGEMSYVVADVSTEDGTAAYVAEAVRRYGGVDVLFSNAGVPGPIKMLSEHTTAEFDEVLAINLRGVWLSVKHTLPELTRRGGGSVLLTSSIAGLAGFAAFSAYVATKHAVVGLARAFAAECAPAGVRVNAICPGFIHNDMLRTLFDKFAPLAGVAEDDLQSALNDRVPAKQFGTDHDVAKLALWLASDDSAYVNGTHQVLDGGVLATIM